MSSSSETATADKHTLDGSCHCGAVKFVAKNVDLTKIARCNCTLCNATGRIGVGVKEGDLLLIRTDGTQHPLGIDSADARSENGFPTELTVYAARGPQHYFCNKCGIHVFNIVDMSKTLAGHSGIYLSVNVLCLDLNKVGKDIKEVAQPAGMAYLDGRSGTWAKQKGEPWAGGVW